jgi:flagellar L-ring protein precursor FlgH
MDDSSLASSRDSLWRGLLLALLALLPGCASVPEAPPPMATVQIQMVPAPVRESGSIWATSGSLSLFEDRKARDVGDLVTIVLTERTNARSSQSTSTSRNSATSVAPPTLFGGQVTLDGRNVLEQSLASESSFDGSGDLSQSNRLDGNITATVVSRLPNGNLVVQGEKWIRLTHGAELVRVQGIVRPTDIAPDNTVASSRVAEARISYSASGSAAQANAQGWFSRFFAALSPF